MDAWRAGRPAPLAGPRFEPGALDVLLGDAVPVTLTGLTPGAEAEIEAERIIAGYRPQAVRSCARFVADANGVIDVARTPSIGGGYVGVDPSGLFWSMEPVPGYPEGLDIGAVRLTARLGGRVVAIGSRRLLHAPADIEQSRVDVTGGGLLFTAATGSRLPAIITLGGSEGGGEVARLIALRFAARGFAALSLPYYSPDHGLGQDLPGLPRDFVDIPIERLQHAYDWLALEARVDVGRVGLWGVSKGAELALLGAVSFGWVRAVAAIVPSDVVWEGFGTSVSAAGVTSSFSQGAAGLPFLPYVDMRQAQARLRAGERDALRRAHDQGRARHRDRMAAARIPVERFAGPMLVAGSDDDATWPSGEMARNIAACRQAAGLDTTLLEFERAGHVLSGPGWGPAYWSATPRETSAAQRALWDATFAFFAAALKD